MRDKIKILWIDDSLEWLKTAEDELNRYVKEMHVEIELEIETNAGKIYHKIQKQSTGFNAYDIFMIDYNLSLEEKDNEDKIFGNDLITKLRRMEVFVDILFYSSRQPDVIREIISKHTGSYEGVYISDRSGFMEKALRIIKKNARNLYSLSNIRGYLTNQTCENDFIVNSYIFKVFNCLTYDKKVEILKGFEKQLLAKNDQNMKQYRDVKNKIDCFLSNGNKEFNMKRIFKDHSSIITQTMTYYIFMSIITELHPEIVKRMNINDYLSDIVKIRNTLAHKKLNLCREQKYIVYADDIDQYEERKCFDSCKNHSERNKISIEKWEEIREKAIAYSEIFDTVFEKLTNITDHDRDLEKG